MVEVKANKMVVVWVNKILVFSLELNTLYQRRGNSGAYFQISRSLCLRSALFSSQDLHYLLKSKQTRG